MTDPTEAPRRWRRTRRFVLLLAVALAGLLLLGLVATRVLVAGAEREYPAIGRLVVVDGLRQHVLERGSGPPVVFVHGAFGGLHDFEATVLDRAAERYRCIAWDRPGHGYSDRSDAVNDPAEQARVLFATLDELAVDRAVLVGFSYGGAVVLAAALAEPQRTRAVVLLNGPSHTWPDPIAFAYQLPAIPFAGPLLTETVLMPIGTLLAADRIANAFDPLPIPVAFAASPLALSLRPASYRANAEDMRTLKPFFRQVRERYRQLHVPITMLVADGDRVVSPTIHSEQLEHDAPNVTVLRVADAGHQLLYTHPDLVLEVIDRAARGP